MSGADIQNRPLHLRWSEKVRWTPGCWIWTGATNSNGYGHIATGDRPYKGSIVAHRAAYVIHRGPIPEGLDLDHLCRVRRCVNPWHLEPVTRRENSLRGASPRIRSYWTNRCKRGHPFDEANTIIQQDGRTCRTCREARRRKAA